MKGRPPREAIMAALFDALVAAVRTPFTADTVVGSGTLGNPSTLNGLFVGLPVFGTGVPRGALIVSVTPTLTLSQPATLAGTMLPMTTGFLTFSRRFQFWTSVTEQPALFLRGADEEMLYHETVLQQQILKAEIWIYSKAGENPKFAPETALNNLLDAVQSAFASDQPMQNRFTLGGLVSWCRLNGKIEKSPGDLDGQAIAVADVEIIVP